MCILKYLKSVPAKGILFTKCIDPLVINAGDINDRRSTWGYFTFVGGNLVTWRSKKQNVVAQSSAEAEFRGMKLGICETLGLELLLTDLGYPPKAPIQLYYDNKAARDDICTQFGTTRSCQACRSRQGFRQGKVGCNDIRVTQDSIRGPIG
uniref:Mitochondrial protein n=1 Tax=Solanum lycopersicum TaxID=4081 RepID=A0A3Q7J741_SOLLC